MRRIVKNIIQVIQRLLEANLKMEHYWFFPKTIVIPIEKEKNPGKN